MISAQTSQPEKRVWGQWVQDHQHWDRLKNRNPKRVKNIMKKYSLLFNFNISGLVLTDGRLEVKTELKKELLLEQQRDNNTVVITLMGTPVKMIYIYLVSFGNFKSCFMRLFHSTDL